MREFLLSVGVFFQSNDSPADKINYHVSVVKLQNFTVGEDSPLVYFSLFLNIKSQII